MPFLQGEIYFTFFGFVVGLARLLGWASFASLTPG